MFLNPCNVATVKYIQFLMYVVLHNGNFTNVMNHNVNIFLEMMVCQRGQVENRWAKPLVLSRRTRSLARPEVLREQGAGSSLPILRSGLPALILSPLPGIPLSCYVYEGSDGSSQHLFGV